LNDVFAAQGVRLLSKLGVFLWAKDNLSESFAVAHINEDHAAMVAGAIHPTRKRDIRADVGFAKRIAVVCAIHAMLTVSKARDSASD
jgi:hypothetical protein